MRIFTIAACLIALCKANNHTHRIYNAAYADRLDLESVPLAAEALASIQAIYDLQNVTIPPGVTEGCIFDVHAHVIPPWYRLLVPTTGQSPTPVWNLDAHLAYMADQGIKHGVLSISTPGSVVFPGSRTKSAALARLLNEYLAALAFRFPDLFSFFAVMPLPYTDAAIAEANYALTHLNATGIGLLSNHEGLYLGNSAFAPFFAHLNATRTRTRTGARAALPAPIFVHPTGPCLHAPNSSAPSLISANPTLYPEGTVEFYFETARTFMDLTLTQTLSNFTALKWLVPHAGGAFPAIVDRFLSTQPAEPQAKAREAFKRLFWDVAGPVFPRQIWGLLGYGVPVGQVVYGSDFPYAPPSSYRYEIEAIENATFLSDDEKSGLFARNGRAMFE